MFILKYNNKSQSLINQGNILTDLNDLYRLSLVDEKSQSLINQGNILTINQISQGFIDKIPVAIPYKSGKYSYGVKMEKIEIFNCPYGSQSLINQGNILTL